MNGLSSEGNMNKSHTNSPPHRTMPSCVGFSCALHFFPLNDEFPMKDHTVYVSSCLPMTGLPSLPASLPLSLPSFLVVMHSALFGSISKSIFLADFRKSTTPSKPIIQLNITCGRQKRRKTKTVSERRHAVSTYTFPLLRVNEVCRHPEFCMCAGVSSILAVSTLFYFFFRVTLLGNIWSISTAFHTKLP